MRDVACEGDRGEVEGLADNIHRKLTQERLWRLEKLGKPARMKPREWGAEDGRGTRSSCHGAVARRPCSFIEEVLRDPETGRPFELLPCERTFLRTPTRPTMQAAWSIPSRPIAARRRPARPRFAAMHILTTTLVFGGRFAEAYCIANDLEQARDACSRPSSASVEASPLSAHARPTSRRTGSSSLPPAQPSPPSPGDYAGAAGANPNHLLLRRSLGVHLASAAHRLWDEMVPVPTRKISCRLTVTYAGFSGEIALLEDLYKRGLAQPEVGPDLHAGDGC